MKKQIEKQELRVQKLVEDAKKNYEGLKALLPENNPAAWKALLFIRAKVRRARTGWLTLMLDNKKTHSEKDILVGQYHAALLLFDIIDQTREINKNMIPGKEADYIREKLYRKPNDQQG